LAGRHQIDSIYTDFSSAFDLVDHGLLIFKLEKYGIKGPLLGWIKSYLTGRTQKINLMGILSDITEVTSGVPQGSILGPLLFVIFTNDISFLLTDCEISCYADDLKIFKRIENDNDSLILQNNLDKLYKWTLDNGMTLNIKKCAIISFCKKKTGQRLFDYKINDETLKRTQYLRDLGLILDSSFSFKQHYDKIHNCGMAVLGFIKRRVKELNNPYLCKTLYCALVQPHLEYASIVWSPYTNVDKARIESVQKQFLLFALKGLNFDGFRLPSYKNRLLLLNMTTLETRREIASATFIFDIIKDNVDVPELKHKIQFNENRHNLRHPRILKETLSTVNYEFYDTLNVGIRLFNVNSDCFDVNINRITYKKRLNFKFKRLFVTY
jgi:hypothetical protein